MSISKLSHKSMRKLYRKMVFAAVADEIDDDIKFDSETHVYRGAIKKEMMPIYASPTVVNRNIRRSLKRTLKKSGS